ncbi:MAG: hypothetical protein K2M76_01120, partial [Muribaculaceae bacterium]|nr:hypothetical protein [Muribaculaceae bacterium]
SSRTFSDHTYHYYYDANNRLTSASCNAHNDESDFSTGYEYDAMSNITALWRMGVIDRVGDEEYYGGLDNIEITYDGNRAVSVSAETDAVTFEGMTGLGLSATNLSITYDSSGRLYSDETRGICSVDYDNEGHPTRIVLDSGCEQHDVWDGFGNHLSTTYFAPDATGALTQITCKEYTGAGHVFVNGVLQMMRFPGGYFKGRAAYYYVTDYQGNTTAVVDAGGNIVERTDYYPYGEPWREPSAQPFLYSGNERLLLNGLREYDFHDRRYNAGLGIFNSWDKRQESYPWLSPYCMCAGNPVMNTDPSGLLWHPVKNKDNKYVGYEWIEDLPRECYGPNSNFADELYEYAIFFSSEGSNEKRFNPNSNYNMGSSIATVYHANGSITKYNACTYPSNMEKYATVPEGIYEAQKGDHRGSKKTYQALRMSDVGTNDFQKSSSIELGCPNPAHPEKTTANGINIHKPIGQNITGFDSKNNPASAGCLLIDINSWDDFIDSFPERTTISVTVSRSISTPYYTDYPTFE